MILTKEFSSAKSLDQWLREPETHELFEITTIDWTALSVRCQTKTE